MSRFPKIKALLSPPKQRHLSYYIILVIILLFVTSVLVRMSCVLYTEYSTRTTTTGAGQDKQPRILCWILTYNSTENNRKCEAVRRTWAKRCDKYLIVTNGTHLEEEPGGENVLRLPIEHESRDQLWRKVVATNIYLYETYLDQFDWFMKADDDTYVLVESLRHFLALETARRRPPPPAPRAAWPRGPSPPGELLVYYGHRFKPFVQQGYMSGGSGYVLSKDALRRLVERGFELEIPECGLFDTPNEDVEIGRCLEAVGVEAGDTRDSQGKETFLPLSPSFLLSDDNSVTWYAEYNFYKQPGSDKSNKSCCSSQPISFHYIDPQLMYLIDWLLYDVKKRGETE